VLCLFNAHAAGIAIHIKAVSFEYFVNITINLFDMSFILTALKILASIFLVALFITSVFKAHPRTHNPKNGHLAEYTTGFILFTATLAGLYYLWS
jgi:hypothetical protein